MKIVAALAAAAIIAATSAAFAKVVPCDSAGQLRQAEACRGLFRAL